jgi:hypothetical protein
MVAPFILPAKLLLQDLCRRQVQWNDELMGADLKGWKQWLRELPRLNEFKTPRCYKPEDVSEITSCQLHTFADASDVGYGVVSYLRLVCSTGIIHCAFVMSKARVAPLKKLTIPRLELQAAITAVRISSMIKNDLEYDIKKTGHLLLDRQHNCASLYCERK